MKRLLLFIAAWLPLSASIASAGGIKLAWNDCLGAGGASNRTFACDTNVGSNDLYVSFDPPVELPDVNGSNPIIDLFSTSSQLPAWWQFKNAGSCRQTAMSAAPVFDQTAPSGCVDLWGVNGLAGIAGYFVTAVLPSLELNHAFILGS